VRLHRYTIAQLVLLAASCEYGSYNQCVTGAKRMDGKCRFVDAAIVDASMDDDGGSLSDAGRSDSGGRDADVIVECTDSLQCANPTPFCSTMSECVQCLDAIACPSNSPVCGADGACSRCAGAPDCTRFANTRACSGAGSCVECVQNTDCKTSAAPRCGSDNRCTTCVDDNDCAPFAQVCDTAAKQCVQCTGTKTSRCNGDVCDSVNRTCETGVKPASADLCESCVSDAQCGKTAPSLCMPTSFSGTSTGNFCLPKRDSTTPGSCISDRRPFITTVNGGVGDPLASVDGVIAPVCKLRATTCEGFNDFSNTSCAGPSDNASCGVAGLADGICAPVPADTIHRCSMPCGGNDDCKVGFTCTGSGYCSL